jgi:hypothetical protein
LPIDEIFVIADIGTCMVRYLSLVCAVSEQFVGKR